MAADDARPSAEPIRLVERTTVKDPDTGEERTLAAGTTLSAATAARLGLKRPKR